MCFTIFINFRYCLPVLLNFWAWLIKKGEKEIGLNKTCSFVLWWKPQLRLYIKLDRLETTHECFSYFNLPLQMSFFIQFVKVSTLVGCFRVDICEEKFLAYFWWCWHRLKACTFISMSGVNLFNYFFSSMLFSYTFLDHIWSSASYCMFELYYWMKSWLLDIPRWTNLSLFLQFYQ